MRGFWAPLSGAAFEGYEIHHGATRADAGCGSKRPLQAALPRDGGWQSGAVLAIYPHGLFESARVIRSLFGRDAPTLETTLDGLADFIDRHFEPGVLTSLIA